MNILKENYYLRQEKQAERMVGIFLDIVKGQLEITQKDSDNYLWHSFIFLIRKNDRIVVGSADFKNIPNPNALFAALIYRK